MKVRAEHAKETASVATGAFDETVGMSLVWQAKVVLNACDSDELFHSSLNEVLGVV